MLRISRGSRSTFLKRTSRAAPTATADKPTLDRVRCTFGKKLLYGKIQIVTAFPDVKVQLVRAFADKCGQWQTVDAFPDTKVQFVDAFADVKIRYVEHFPGIE